jgi:hypothetical protein
MIPQSRRVLWLLWLAAAEVVAAFAVIVADGRCAIVPPGWLVVCGPQHPAGSVRVDDGGDLGVGPVEQCASLLGSLHFAGAARATA